MLAVSCQKERFGGMTLLTEGFNGNNTKVLVNDTASTWATGDEVRINDQVATVSVSASTASVHLNEGVTAPFYGVYPASIYSSNDGASYTLNLPATYTYASNGTNQVLGSPMVGYTTDESTMVFKHLTAAVTVQVVNYHYDYAIVVDSVQVTSNNYKLCGEMTVSIASDITVDPVATDDASLKSVKMKMSSGITIAAGDSTAVQVPVLPAGDGNKFTVTVWAHRADQASVAVELTRTQTTGGALLRANLGYARYTLGGPFSVSASKKVVFSGGNLQYKASTGTWRFAEHQYDYIGSDNANISADYDGYIDLFGWGTGNNPTNISTTAGDYSSFNDWGTAAASNIGTGWYTLSKTEWVYLTTGGRSNKTAGLEGTNNGVAKYTKAIVNSVKGAIIFPDNYVHPTGVSETGTHSFNTTTTTYNKFEITDGWEKMELAGAVFLPAAGTRNGTVISDVNTTGGYWSSTSYSSGKGYLLSIGNYAFSADNYSTNAELFKGNPVRLVRTVE